MDQRARRPTGLGTTATPPTGSMTGPARLTTGPAAPSSSGGGRTATSSFSSSCPW
jgi:hypothetical protein